MLCALIMAGGRGTRFWPKSTASKPKQFINLVGDKTMIQMTIDRIIPIIPIENIYICTTKEYKEILEEQVPELPKENIILEPVMRNTAPCILLSTLYIKNRCDDANILVLPSDHIIGNINEFQNVIKITEKKINSTKSGVITIGIVPDRPETGYGYIKLEDGNKIELNTVCNVERFVEKPNATLAQEYIDSNKYLWNAGMFMFNSDYIEEIYKNIQTDMYDNLSKLPYGSSEFYDALNKQYELCDSISFDYGIMEHLNEIYVVPSDFGWDDVGSWGSVERYIKKDDNLNVVKGNASLINAKNNIIYGSNKKIIISNLDDIYCIESNDVILIGKKSEINDAHKYKTEGV